MPRPPCPAVDARPGFILPWRWIYRQAHCTIRKSTGAANCLCSSPSATIVAIRVSEERPVTVSQFAVAAYRRSMRRLPHQELVSHQAPPLRRLAERHLAPGSAHRLAAWSHRHLARRSGFVPVARSALSPPRVVLLIHSFTSSVAYASWVPRGGWPSASLHSQCSEFVDYGLGGSD